MTRSYGSATSPCCCPTTPHVYAFTRSLGGETLLTLGNFTGEEQVVALEDHALSGAQTVIGNYPERPLADGGVTLRPWEVLVLRPVRPAR